MSTPSSSDASSANNAVKIAIVTGASSGIGAAAVSQLAAAGFHVVGGARRLERVAAVTNPVGGTALSLDVTEPESICRFIEATRRLASDLGGAIHLLVNNAGGALGLDRLEDARDDTWETMYRTNVLGTMRMSRELMGDLIESGDGHIINIGSIAGFETYPGGAGYTAAKHGQRAVSRTLRLELLGKPVRVTEIAPGLVETEFSIVRFDGDTQRAEGVYAGMEPLLADDIADCITWAATRPAHVNIDEIVVRPRDQAAATLVHRRNED